MEAPWKKIFQTLSAHWFLLGETFLHVTNKLQNIPPIENIVTDKLSHLPVPDSQELRSLDHAWVDDASNLCEGHG